MIPSRLLASLSAFAIALVASPAYAITFTDVPADAWFATYVQQASDLGIVSGYKDANGKDLGIFKPEQNVTLSEALKIAIEGAGYDVDSYPVQDQEDDAMGWLKPYYRIAFAEKFGIFVGGNEHVYNAASRMEVARIIVDAFYPGQATEIMERKDYQNPYSDVMSNNTYQDGTFGWGWSSFILRLTEDGVISGDKDAAGNPTGTVRPSEPINRAEMLKMVMTAREKIGTVGHGVTPHGSSNASTSAAITMPWKTTVHYTGKGFEPHHLTVCTWQIGTTVTFINETQSGMWVASDPHPVHTDEPGFDAKQPIPPTGEYSHTFTGKDRTISYHNHLYPKDQGVIQVVESCDE